MILKLELILFVSIPGPWKGLDQECKKGDLMILFNTFTLPQKENCDLCRIKTNKRKTTENQLLDLLFKLLDRNRFDFVFD